MWARACAALPAGFLVAAAVSAWVAWLPPGAWTSALVPSLIVFIPAWMFAAVWAFSFRTARRAWTVMLLCAACGVLALRLLRATGMVQ